MVINKLEGQPVNFFDKIMEFTESKSVTEAVNQETDCPTSTVESLESMEDNTDGTVQSNSQSQNSEYYENGVTSPEFESSGSISSDDDSVLSRRANMGDASSNDSLSSYRAEISGNSSWIKKELDRTIDFTDTALSLLTCDEQEMKPSPENSSGMAISGKHKADDMKLCNVCGVQADLACGGCYKLVYCSPEHQEKDWFDHHSDCHFYSLHRSTSVKYQGPFRFVKKWSENSEVKAIHRMKALCDIPAKSKIMDEKPFLVAPWPRIQLRKNESAQILPGLRPLCLTCFGCCSSLNFDFKMCPACNLPLCSYDCPYLSTHKESECKYMQILRCKLGEPDQRTQKRCLKSTEVTELLYTDVMMLRFILRYRNLQQASSSNKSWNDTWFKLMKTWKGGEPTKRSLKSKRGESIFQNIATTLPLAYFALNGRIDMLWELYSIVESNSFTLDLPFRRFKVLCNVLPNVSHSCLPNSHAFLVHDGSFDPEELTVRLISGKEILKGESVTVSYCPLILDTGERRPMLWEQYLFWCNCFRCLDPTECGTYLSGVKCTFCNVGLLLPPPSLLSQSQSSDTGSKTDNPFYEMAMGRNKFLWTCTNIGNSLINRCSSYDNMDPASYKMKQSTPFITKTLEKVELESIESLGCHYRLQRFHSLHNADLPQNSYIFLKLYEDILRGVLFPMVYSRQNLSAFPFDWLTNFAKAKMVYQEFMVKICPGFDFQGFPQLSHVIMESEFYELDGAKRLQNDKFLSNMYDANGMTTALRPLSLRIVIPSSLNRFC